MSHSGDERPGMGPIGGRGLSGALGGGLARLERQERRAASSGATQGRAHLGLRLSVISAIVVLLLGVLLVRLWSVQVIDHSLYRSGALQELYKTVYTPAPRGEIVASNGQPLATDTAEEVVTVEPAIDPLTGNTWIAKYPVGEANLAALLGISPKQVNLDLNNVQNVPHEPVVVAIGPAQGVTEQAVVQISENPGRYPGVAVSRQYVRSYPQGSLAAQIIGYTGAGFATVGYGAKGKPIQSALDIAEYNKYLGPESSPTFGQSGLEEEYQRYLFGAPGRIVQRVDPTGSPVGVASTTLAAQGDTVVLNMDLPLEQMLSTALANQITSLRAGAAGAPGVPPDGAAVVMDAQTGAVLAIASYPSYNNNEWVGGISTKQYAQLVSAYGHPLDDYAVSNPQAPGSDFKLASATAALNDGVISPYYVFNDPGYYTVNGYTLHDCCGEVPGPITVVQAITESSDDFFYNIGALFWEAYQSDPAQYPYGAAPIQQVAQSYGLGVDVGIDLPANEISPGQIDTPAWRKLTGQTAPWYVGDNMEMAFGQGETEITPIELADAYATFANGGTRYAPELAGEIVSPAGRLLRKIARVTGHVHYASSAGYDAILQGFQGVTQNPLGTAYGAFQGFDFAKWDVAGKTGTASGPTVQPTSWFVAFGGPRGQAPKYVVAVEVGQAGYGATASAPVARDVFDYLYSHGAGPAALRP